jgi:hypothetical protein
MTRTARYADRRDDLPPMPLSATEWERLPVLPIAAKETVIQIHDMGVYYATPNEELTFKSKGYRHRREPNEVALTTVVVEEGDRLSMYRMPKDLAAWAYRVATSDSVRGRLPFPLILRCKRKADGRVIVLRP